ncbi:MAG TPA: hypothetical protein VFH69_04555 [Gemmatimonadota bacterium]|nr:hypothetical protein [Gemmatimonadota bacterium]
MNHPRTSVVTAAAFAIVLACNDSGSLGPISDPDYDPMLDPADFGGPIDNPLFPLVPGTTFHYEGESEDGPQSNDVTVTHETRQIMGITATVVRDVEFVAGQLVEETFDWYAQDDDGNVWYLGEDSHEFEDGEPVESGSWEAGVDGAKAGIIMKADPQVGDRYYQEFYIGEAEDEGEVIAVNQSVTVPFGEFSGCVRTADFTRLEPDQLENKVYCPGVGLVSEGSADGEESNELVDVETP